jgi:hypothetical protein
MIRQRHRILLQHFQCHLHCLFQLRVVSRRRGRRIVEYGLAPAIFPVP